MALVRVRHIKRVRIKGRTYWYHRLTGERLPDLEADRLARALAINRTLGDKGEPGQGSLEAIARAYLGSAEFRQLKASSQKHYRYFIDMIRPRWGEFDLATIEPRHVRALRDELADKPSTANMAVTILGVLFRFAIDRGFAKSDPTRGIKALRGGPGHKPWSDAEIEAFLAAADEDMAVALLLGLYTGQRRGDVLAMSWADIEAGAVRVVQEKTGERLWIPLARELQAALGRRTRTSPLILPMTKGQLHYRFTRAMKAAGLSGLTYHGLRYSAATRLAELGCSDMEIQAVTGHRSRGNLARYTRHARQKVLAKAAIARLDRNKNKTKSGKPGWKTSQET